ncbi:Uncharacterised protein [Bordetella ansorpii]|uniref:Uncharacterized protein n=1 Tax=Bordetella ansorpii TaxID=288768 RepID=A0A157MTE5_9BORD|nr:hypothetical protein [Bordetella ansorpii]SAI12278.1 Uncharacterised protein [Bordetella ansorpii]
MNFAAESAAHPDRLYTKRPIVTPAVVGAVICVSGCLDMTTQTGLDEFSEVLEQLKAVGAPLARNDDNNPLLRRLNNQVFTALHAFRQAQSMQAYQMVRGAFLQGEPLGDAYSGFSRDGHIQLAVRDAGIVVSWFLPQEDRLMTADEYEAAQALRAAAPVGSARKPRRRAP